jgi:hypothetical protein
MMKAEKCNWKLLVPDSLGSFVELVLEWGGYQRDLHSPETLRFLWTSARVRLTNGEEMRPEATDQLLEDELEDRGREEGIGMPEDLRK